MNAIDLIKKFEGLRLESYQDIAGVWTIGYGHTDGVRSRDKITKKQADQYLLQDMEGAQYTVSALVKVPLTDNMRAALVSFVYNVGRNAFSRSTLLKKLNAGDYGSASLEFLKWNKAGGKRLKGLLNRRLAEHQLFLSVD